MCRIMPNTLAVSLCPCLPFPFPIIVLQYQEKTEPIISIRDKKLTFIVYFADFACFLSLATAPPIFAWLSDLNPFDAEQRAFTLGFAIAFYYACGAWSGPLIWPASEAPVRLLSLISPLLLPPFSFVLSPPSFISPCSPLPLLFSP